MNTKKRGKIWVISTDHHLVLGFVIIKTCNQLSRAELAELQYSYRLDAQGLSKLGYKTWFAIQVHCSHELERAVPVTVFPGSPGWRRLIMRLIMAAQDGNLVHAKPQSGMARRKR